MINLTFERIRLQILEKGKFKTVIWGKVSVQTLEKMRKFLEERRKQGLDTSVLGGVRIQAKTKRKDRLSTCEWLSCTTCFPLSDVYYALEKFELKEKMK